MWSLSLGMVWYNLGIGGSLWELVAKLGVWWLILGIGGSVGDVVAQ
jgi:hypothetical protein